MAFLAPGHVAILGLGPKHAADLLHRAAGAQIAFANHEDHRIEPAKGVAEHQVLELAVGAAAPMIARQEGPADLDLTRPGISVVVAAGPDHAPALPLADRQAAARCKRVVEIAPEHRLLPAVMGRVDRPDQRIGRGRVERVPVLRHRRAQLDRVAGQDWLQVWCAFAHVIQELLRHSRESEGPAPYST
jgi:hypothetical protein